MPSFSQWNQQEYPAGNSSFNPTSLTGPPPPFWRDQLDYLRSGQHTPEAQYPAGYLGNVPSRREDRLLDGLKQRQQRGPKIRGIHKNDRLDLSDYYWQPEFNPDSGLMNQAMAFDSMDGFVVQRYVSPGLVNDPMAPEFTSPRRANILAHDGQGLTPPWGTPPAPVQPGLVRAQI